MKRKRNFTVVMALLLICLIGIGFAYLSTNLTINGTANIKNSTWDVHFDNLKVTTGSVEPVTAPTLTDTTKTSFKVELSNPGDFYEFTVNVVNEGSIDAMIDSFEPGELTGSQPDYLDYSVTYDDGATINDKDMLKAGGYETVKVRIEFMSDVESSDLPSSDVEVSMPIEIDYVQNDGGQPIVHMALNDANENGVADIGETINIRSEYFYVISNSGDTIKALADYNLYVGNTYTGTSTIALESPTGLQNSSATAYKTDTPYVGTVQFADTAYWSGNAKDEISLDDSNVITYLNAYQTKLNNLGGVVNNIGLITLDELSSLGCTTSCDISKSWLYKTSYWTSNMSSSTGVYGVFTDNSIDGLGATSNDTLGIRPVITINVDDLN